MNANGTALPIATHSDLWQVEVIGMGSTPKPVQKAAVTGEVKYNSGCIMRERKADGRLEPAKAASIHVLKPASIYELGTLYRAQGRIYVQPYTPNGSDFGTLSITVEELVPVPAGKGAAA